MTQLALCVPFAPFGFFVVAVVVAVVEPVVVEGLAVDTADLGYGFEILAALFGAAVILFEQPLYLEAADPYVGLSVVVVGPVEVAQVGSGSVEVLSGMVLGP